MRPRPFDCIIFLSGVQVADTHWKTNTLPRLQVGEIQRNEAGIVFGAATDPGNGLQPAAWPPCDFIAGSSVILSEITTLLLREEKAGLIPSDVAGTGRRVLPLGKSRPGASESF